MGVLPGKRKLVRKKESREGLCGIWCWYCCLLVGARVDWETGSAEREMRRRNETLLDPSKD